MKLEYKRKIIIMQGKNKNNLLFVSKMKLIYKRKMSVCKAKIRYLHTNLSVLLNI